MSDTPIVPPVIPVPAFVKTPPRVRDIGAEDVIAAFREGLADFRAAPFYGLIFGGFYAVGGLFLLWLTVGAGVGYLTYPFATGFALLGPFVAVGCYEVSRRLENGEPLDMAGVFGVMFRQSGRELGWMAFVTLFIFILWMYQVRMLFILCLGLQGFATLPELGHALTSTTSGWLFLGLVHLDGLAFALVTFSLTVVSFPLVLDRDVDFITAMITSVQSVVRNPKTMISWGLIVAGLLFLSIVPMFLGLIFTLPVLGHATWHLYRRLVAPDGA